MQPPWSAPASRRLMGATVALAALILLWSAFPMRREALQVAQVSDGVHACQGVAIAVEYPYEKHGMPPKECVAECGNKKHLSYVVYTNIDPVTGHRYGAQCGNTIAEAPFNKCGDYGEDHFLTCNTNIEEEVPLIDIAFQATVLASPSLSSAPRSSQGPLSSSHSSSSGIPLFLSVSSAASIAVSSSERSSSSSTSHWSSSIAAHASVILSSDASSSGARSSALAAALSSASSSSSNQQESTDAAPTPPDEGSAETVSPPPPLPPESTEQVGMIAWEEQQSSSFVPTLLPRSSGAAVSRASAGNEHAAPPESVGGPVVLLQSAGSKASTTTVQCRDGNSVDGDGCSASGFLEPGIIPRCGDGIVEGEEHCDEGLRNGLSGHCSDQCMVVAPIVARVEVLPTVQSSLTASATSHAPSGSTGPEMLLVTSSGAAAGWAWMRRRRASGR